MEEYEYNWLDCPRCEKTLAFEAQVREGKAEYKQVVCPLCGENLGETKAGPGYKYIGQIHEQFSCTACLDMETLNDI